MSMIARRAMLRALPRTRGMATASEEVSKLNYHEKQVQLREHAAQTADLWRKISFYVAAPAIIVATAWAINREKEHEEHQKHLAEENNGVVPQPPQYEYLNRRVSPFPWGKNSLFFNPHVQKNLEEE